MSIEYHGWVVLATSQDNWGDDDFENGYEGVVQAVERLRSDEGHEPLLPDCDVLPRVLYLKGSQVESLDLVFQAIEEVGALFDRAYGELTVLKEGVLVQRFSLGTNRGNSHHQKQLIEVQEVRGTHAAGDGSLTIR
jgi:hypothetical protein